MQSHVGLGMKFRDTFVRFGLVAIARNPGILYQLMIVRSCTEEVLIETLRMAKCHKRRSNETIWLLKARIQVLLKIYCTARQFETVCKNDILEGSKGQSQFLFLFFFPFLQYAPAPPYQLSRKRILVLTFFLASLCLHFPAFFAFNIILSRASD
jgi:hypothetical protein